MIAAFVLLVLLSVFVLIVRISTTALVLTGLSQELALLQAVSAFTGVGFTTRESEFIVNHPVRRRILIIVMILGNAGFVTAASTFFLSFTDAADALDGAERVALLGIGSAGLWYVAKSRTFDRHLSSIIGWALRRWTRLHAFDFVELLDVGGKYTVRLVKVRPEDWIAGKRLDELNLFEEGVTVLGIHRGDLYLGLPRGETRIEPGDRVVLYGRTDRLSELEHRATGAAGQQAHKLAVEAAQREFALQRAEEQESHAAASAQPATSQPEHPNQPADD